MTPLHWPEWGAEKPDAGPWHYWTSPEGAHHAGPVLDRVTAPMPGVGAGAQVYTVIRCSPCCLIHVTPLPTEEALEDYYAQQFYQTSKPEAVARYEQDRAWWEMTHTSIIQAADALPYVDPAPLRFLDVGCGAGIALDAAWSAGWDTYGIEPNAALAQRLIPRHTTFEGTLARVQQDHPGLTFRLLYLYEVLEHQPNPEAFLLQCSAMLEPGGKLVVVVPNDYNPLQLEAVATLGVPHYWLAPPEHLNYFTPKTLQLLMRRCGFQLTYQRSTYPLERFLLNGKNYIGNDTLGRQCHQERVSKEMEAWHTHRWQFLEQQYQENLQQGIGRELVYIGRKSP